MGTQHQPVRATDLAADCLAVLVGGLIGVPFVVIQGFRLSLGTAVGALVMGIVLGWAHSVRPKFGQLPEAATLLDFTRPGGFCRGMNGMQAGRHVIEAFKAQGVPLLLAGIVVRAISTNLLCLYFGRYGLETEPAPSCWARARERKR